MSQWDSWTFSSELNYRMFDQDVFDLLNQNQGVSLTISSNSIQEEWIQSLRQYVMLRVIYRLGSGGGGFGGR